MTFIFNGYNSEKFGLYASASKTIKAPKRENRINIPFKSGSKDLGGDYYNDKNIVLTCFFKSTTPLSPADIREMAFWLAGKGELTLATEPDLYEVASIYEAPNFYGLFDDGVYKGGIFTLNFLCEPFSRGINQEQNITGGLNLIEYQGTAPSPPLFEFTNTQNTTMTGGITISVMARSEVR